VIRHLGFEIPLYVTQTQGGRLRAPGIGVCHVCLTSKHKVWLIDDHRPICEQCIEVAYAEHGHGLGGQAHPDADPIEVPFETLRKISLTDDFDSAYWNRQIP
jgi:hypothetical protein